MDTVLNLRLLLYFWVSFVLQRASSETLTNSTTSFLQLKRWNVSETRGLGFRFKTFLPDALLLYMDDEGKTNFLRVELFQGKLRLTCSHGLRFGAMAVEIGDNLNDLVWHQVLLERNNSITTISLESGRSKSTVNSREETSLIIKSPMYFGGLPPNLNANRVTQPSVTILSRFLGCITDIELFEYSNSGQGNRRKGVLEKSDGISPGCIDKCQRENTCLNNGTCLNRFTTTGCDCTATGYRGQACEQALPVLGLGQSDYVVFNRSGSNTSISTQQDRIVLRFKTANQHGSLLECGRRSRDYVVIELSRGSLLLRWNLGSGEMYVHVREKACGDDKWHSVDIRRNQRQLDIVIDGGLHVSRSFPGDYVSFDLGSEGDVFIGGMAPTGFSSKPRLSGIAFDGCLQEVAFNGVDIIQGVVSGDENFTTKGHPRTSCDVDPTTAIKTSSTPATEQTTTTTTTTAATTPATSRSQLTTSYTTTRIITTKDYTDKSQRVSTSQTFSNSQRPCSDDEDDCSSEDSGSGENEDLSETSGDASGDPNLIPSFSGEDEMKVEYPRIPMTNNKSKKPSKTGEGEADISQTLCVGDDEDACENADESGQTSAVEPGSGGSAHASPSPRTLPEDHGNKQAKRGAPVKHDSSKKWTLIAGIIVVATLLIAFCIFAIWWLYKNKNNPEWTGMYNGSKEKCLHQAEITDV